MQQHCFYPSWQAILCCSLAFFCACQDDSEYAQTQQLQNTTWAYADTLNFDIDVKDTSALYNLYITFEHADTFAHQNIYLKLSTRFPDGKTARKIRSFDLFNNLGEALGPCSGRRCKSRTLLQNNLYFNQLGQHRITLEQYTRRNPLPGIASVGLTLEKTGKNR